MKRYNSEDYYSVINKNTGIKIADCAQQEDALLMVSFDPQNRIITTNKFLMGQVVDVIMPKALPTTAIVDLGGKWDDSIPEGIDPWNLGGRRMKLPKSQLEIFNP